MKKRIAGLGGVWSVAFLGIGAAAAQPTNPVDTPGFQAFVSTVLGPADTHVSVGAGYIVATINNVIKVFETDGTLVSTRTSIQLLGTTVGDMMTLYDDDTDRFFLSGTNFGSDGIFASVSPVGDPTGAWTTDVIDIDTFHPGEPSEAFPDYPNLGVDEDAVYITLHIEDGSRDQITVILDKADLIAAMSSYHDTLDVYGGATVPRGGSIAQYLVNARSTAGNDPIDITSVQDPLGTETTDLYTYTQQPLMTAITSVDQDGSALSISLVEAALQFDPKLAVYRAETDSLWFAHTTRHSTESRNIIRWYEFDMNGWPGGMSEPSLAQAGVVEMSDGASGYASVFYPAIFPDGEGGACLVFGYSSENQYPGIARVFRRGTDAANTMRSVEFVKAGEGPFLGGAVLRWGDYFGAGQDPDCPGRFWVHGEYGVDGAMSTKWASWIGSFFVNALADINGDGFVSDEDYDAFLDAYMEMDPAADLYPDNTIDFTDYLIYLAASDDPCSYPGT